MWFEKPPKTFDDQVDLLISRGMRIDDPKRARRYLSHLNYYRLAAYWLPFEQDHTTHRFKPGVEFDLVLEYYIFDRKLRLRIMDAIERIEVSLRTRWAYHIAHSYGPHALLDQTLFKSRWPHTENINTLRETIRRSSEVFIRHFNKYDEMLPPVWVVCKIMTLGQLSKWYANLKRGQPVASGSGCDCSGNRYNCSDFKTQAQTQECYDYCREVKGRDAHKLDQDKDGRVCESLP